MAPNFPSARTVSANGIELAVHEAGEGTPVLLLHGFPELAYSWRTRSARSPTPASGSSSPTSAATTAAGAEDAQSYSVKNLVADLTGMLDALEIEQAVFFGHDWGSMPAWYSAVYAPDRVLGVGSLCTPYFTPGEVDLIEAYNVLRGPKHYMATFQEPGVGEAILERDVERTFRALLRGRGYTMDEFEAAPRRSTRSRRACSSATRSCSASSSSPTRSSPSTSTRTATGFTGGLNWYRALHKDWEEAQGSSSSSTSRR